MAKVKLTKNELKKQKDSLKRFQRYLPTLMLKKQQLQMVIRQVESKVRQIEQERRTLQEELDKWIAVFGEDIGMENLIKVERIERETGNIAGVDIPVFKSLELQEIPYDLFTKPLWTDRGIDAIKRIAELDARIDVLKRQIELLSDELRITTQRVNLFEKVMIPETKENIRKIQIYLGDQQTAAVVRGKMAKNKIEKVK
ncbi:MAG: V-type ATP synthase subunit D [Spirochaetaceae bacterium]|nr:V-type ATP synthase subunit D [Spirochaetaceae bacterium]MCF7948041.1 V-type ATP synthase subunit D [Spirochaetia bacterium]MCF7950401.1 V-type ATP synthase subunit D [Spirochaetaceae bacterium]